MADHLARLVLVGGRAAGRRQEVDSQGDETLQRHAPDDVLDVRVEAAVLVDDQHRRQPAHVAGGARHVARQLAMGAGERSEEHTSELQSLMRISYAVFCLKKKNTTRLHQFAKNTNDKTIKRTTYDQ